MSRRDGSIDLTELRRLDPIKKPDRFRRVLQSQWAVNPTGESEPDDGMLLRCAQAVGTPVLDHSIDDREVWNGEAFRQWSTTFDRHRLELFWQVTRRPVVTITVPTRRPECVEIWAPIIALQTHRPLQVVAALHGRRWTSSDEDRIRATLVPAGIDVVIVRVDESKVLGEVLQAASDRAEGDVLVKWDDDDLYSTTHVVDLLRARHYSGATIVGKAGDFYYVEGADTTVRRLQAPREIFSPTLAGSTLTIGRDDLRDVGGWDALAHREDAALINKVRGSGGTSYRTVGFGFLVVRRADPVAHTWNPGDEVFLAPGNPRRPGLATDWAMIDLPDEIIERAVRPAGGGR
ncbi:MAG: hypothetical protein O3B23_09720 [Actinomycetota bacterium]|nr:hypothetical protein [Actinomycetota bacterium]